MKYLQFAALLILVTGCGQKKESQMRQHIDQFAKVEITADLSGLSPVQQEVVKLLVRAGQIADEIFWKQTSHDAVSIREQLKDKKDRASMEALEYVLFSYGPYDRVTEARFVGEGDSVRPPTGAFYPADMTKEELQKYIELNPEQEKELTGQYSVVLRDGAGLKAVPYHEFYKEEVTQISTLLNQAAEKAENKSLKAYLAARARAVMTDEYYESDVAWMQLKNNAIDIVIGPIENYEDKLFNYRTAYEAAVMIKDVAGTKELQVFQSHLDALEKNLPQRKEYIRPSAGKGNVLEIVNIVFFAGDFQAGIKTIAASLPNDPNVHKEYGGKKQMYKNLMEAKFDQIVVPIGQRLIAEALRRYVSRRSFTTFVTMHEVSHTLGRGFVYGRKDEKVRKALQELYSPIEEAKADVIGIYNMEYFKKQGMFDDETLKQHYVTYLAGLFRSIRFGAEEAHGKANIAQIEFLHRQGAIGRNDAGMWVVNFDKFHAGVSALGKILLELEAEGDYTGAREFLEEYGHLTPGIQTDIDKLGDIPRDLNTTYSITKSL